MTPPGIAPGLELGNAVNEDFTWVNSCTGFRHSQGYEIR